MKKKRNRTDPNRTNELQKKKSVHTKQRQKEEKKKDDEKRTQNGHAYKTYIICMYEIVYL